MNNMQIVKINLELTQTKNLNKGTNLVFKKSTL